jgi:hypothetical protein
MPNLGEESIVGRGDIQFLSRKSFDGKIRSVEGFSTAVGDLVTLTANTGKDMYLARAKVIFRMNTNLGAGGNDAIELSINGVVIETARVHVSVNDGQPTVIYEFRNIGQKVLAGEIIKLEVTVLDTQTDVEGFIECYEEDTGVSPDA